MEELPRDRAINDQPSNLLIKKRKAILPGTKNLGKTPKFKGLRYLLLAGRGRWLRCCG